MQELTLQQFLHLAQVAQRDIQTPVDLHQLMSITDLSHRRKWTLTERVIGKPINKITIDTPEVITDRKDQDLGHKIGNIPT